MPRGVLYETIDMTIEFFKNNSVSFLLKNNNWFVTLKIYETKIYQPAHMYICKKKIAKRCLDISTGFSKRHSGLCFKIVIEKPIASS